MELIAMKCTREQYESMSGFLNLIEQSANDFKRYGYLANKVDNLVAMYDKDLLSKTRIIYEKFNKDVFLKSCGIKVKKDKETTIFKQTINLLKGLNKLKRNINSVDTEYSTDGSYKITITGNKNK